MLKGEWFFINKRKLNHNFLLFRGVPLRNSHKLYNSDVWLRKNYFLEDKTNLADDVNGLFQKEMYNQVKKDKYKTLSDFYKIDEFHLSETFFSTSLDLKIAEGFGIAKDGKFGHLIIINSINSPVILFGDMSAVADEMEVLLPPNAQLKLDRVEYLSDVDLQSLGFSKSLHKPDKYSLCFFLTYNTEFKNYSKELIAELEKKKIFWNNINKFIKISNEDDYK